MSQINNFVKKLPQSRTFLFCLPLKLGAIVAAAIGICYPSIFVKYYYSVRFSSWALNTGGFMVAQLFICSIVLAFGILTTSRQFVMVWVYCGVVFITAMFVIMAGLALKHISRGDHWLTWKPFGLLLLYFFFIYLVIVVKSYASELTNSVDSGEEREPCECECVCA